VVNKVASSGLSQDRVADAELQNFALPPSTLRTSLLSVKREDTSGIHALVVRSQELAMHLVASLQDAGLVMSNDTVDAPPSILKGHSDALSELKSMIRSVVSDETAKQAMLRRLADGLSLTAQQQQLLRSYERKPNRKHNQPPPGNLDALLAAVTAGGKGEAPGALTAGSSGRRTKNTIPADPWAGEVQARDMLRPLLRVLGAPLPAVAKGMADSLVAASAAEGEGVVSLEGDTDNGELGSEASEGASSWALLAVLLLFVVVSLVACVVLSRLGALRFIGKRRNSNPRNFLGLVAAPASNTAGTVLPLHDRGPSSHSHSSNGTKARPAAAPASWTAWMAGLLGMGSSMRRVAHSTKVL
jgi:hypothetical protein